MNEWGSTDPIPPMVISRPANRITRAFRGARATNHAPTSLWDARRDERLQRILARLDAERVAS